MSATALALLPRLLLGVGERPMTELAEHLGAHGPLRSVRGAAAVELVESAGLRGRGGAGFPAARKLRAVAASRGRPIVVANGCEGEPASKKDGVLLLELPHLVLDGSAAAARAVGASEVVVALKRGEDRGLFALQRAIDDRRRAGLGDEPAFKLAALEPRYIAGQETALLSALGGGSVKPTLAPPRPFERGLQGRPTLVQNVETLAHMALIARHGAAWFREVGPGEDPGSALVTVSGAVAAPGVYELEQGTPLLELLDLAGLREDLEAVLIGGYFGTWLRAGDAEHASLDRESLGGFGATLGAGVIVALGASACPVAETSRIAHFFAAESARQCGPCINGLDAIADTIHGLASGTAPSSADADLDRWIRQLPRRGACQHPDGAVRFISSSLRVFEAEFRDHARRGPCERCARPPVLPVARPMRRRARCD